MVQWSYQINYDWGSGWHYGMNWVFNNPLNDPQNSIIYSTHIYSNSYSGFFNSHTGTTVTDYDSIEYALSECKVYDVAAIYPVFIGEIGCSNWDSINQPIYFNNTLTALDQHGIGYAVFAGPPWTSATEWGLVQSGAPNYTLNTAGTILVDHLGGTNYADWSS